MTTYIGGISALQYLLSRGTSERYTLSETTRFELEPVRWAPHPSSVPYRRISRLGRPDGIYTPTLEVNVTRKEDRCRSKLITSHVWTGPARGTYLRIDDEFRVLTPEAVFAQLAAKLDLVNLVELGMILCSTYSPGGSFMETKYNLKPLTTKRKLSAYIAKLTLKRGIKNAQSAIRYLENGSASPIESKIATSLLLPRIHGGYQSNPKLNVEIELTKTARGLGVHSVRKPDFFWTDKMISLEYDSREWHDDVFAAKEDEQRRNELAAMGINGFIMRPRHLSSPLAYESIMAQVKHALNERLDGTTKDLARKRANVYDRLFGARKWDPMDFR